MKTKLIILSLLSLSFMANAQWQNIYAIPNHNSPLALISCENNLFVGTGGGGVYRSLDNGDTWNAANNGIFMGGAYVYSLASRNDSIYAGGFGEVSFTNDEGANWSVLNLNLSLSCAVYAVIVKGPYIFAGVGHSDANGVYRKLLTGGGWAQMNTGLPINVSVNAFAIKNNSLFAGTEAGVYTSTDNGSSWTLLDNGMSLGLAVRSLHVFNSFLIAGTNNGIFVSSDDGATWNTTNGLPANSVITSITDNATQLAAGTYDGAYLSSNSGSTWTKVNYDAGNVVSFYSLTSQGGEFYAGSGQGILTSDSDVTLSIFDSNADNALSVYPNPFSVQTTLNANEPFADATLTITNSFGLVVRQTNNISGQSVTISRDELPNGLYFIQLTEGNKTLGVGKLVVADK